MVKLPHRQNRKANNENLKLPYSLLSPLMTPVLSRMDNLSVADEKTLLRARFFFCHPDTGTRDYCDLDVPHTVEHALTQCAYPPLENRRSPDITSTSLPAILDGREQDENRTQLRHIIAQLSWSPHFYPKA